MKYNKILEKLKLINFNYLKAIYLEFIYKTSVISYGNKSFTS